MKFMDGPSSLVYIESGSCSRNFHIIFYKSFKIIGSSYIYVTYYIFISWNEIDFKVWEANSRLLGQKVHQDGDKMANSHKVLPLNPLPFST